MKFGLLIFGIIIVLITAVISSQITAEVNQEISQNNQMCNSFVGGIGQRLSADVADECASYQQAENIRTYLPVGYVVGGIFVLCGLFIPKRQKEKYDKESENYRKHFCTKCGTETYEEESFCSKCGKKVK